MKRSAKIAIIAGIAIVVVVSTLAVSIHLRQSTIEGTEHANETVSQKVNEVVNAITNKNTTNSEANESPEQRASEGK